MTKQERQGIADAFRACLPHLWDGVGKRQAHKAMVICHALEKTNHISNVDAKLIVRGRLGEFSIVEDWLSDKIGKRRFLAECNLRRMQSHRRAWVLKLIEEFES